MSLRVIFIVSFLSTYGLLNGQAVRCPVNRWAVANTGGAYIDDIGNMAVYGNFTNLENSEFVNDGNLYFLGNVENRGFLGEGDGAEYILHCDTAVTTISGAGVTEFNRLFVNNQSGVKLESEIRIKTSLTFQNGIIHTDRRSPSYRVSFRPNSVYNAADDTKHINGVVRKQGPDPFTFPVGDGDHLSRIGVVGVNNFDLFQAAYYSKNLEQDVWASPGSFDHETKDFNVYKVQDKEFWTLTGGQATRITLHWTTYSQINQLVANVNDLVVAGWDGFKWVNLGKTEMQSFLGFGIISSRRVIPNNYRAFTFGVSDLDGDGYVDSMDPAPLDACIPDPSAEACQQRVCVSVELGVFLEGGLAQPGNEVADKMRLRLYNFGYLPGMRPKTLFGVSSKPGHPYEGVPWNYDGAEGKEINEFAPTTGDNRYPEEIVDWVMVSLRTSVDASSTVCRKPAMINAEGDVMFTEFFDCCDMASNRYYVVIEHRNHLPVMTPTAIELQDGKLSFDFRKNQSYTRLLGSGQKELRPGVFAMFAGNGDQSMAAESPKDLNANDNSMWLQDNGKHSGYYFQDFDLSGDVNVQDKSLWLRNNGIFTDVDIR